MTNNDLTQISILMDQKLKDFGSDIDKKLSATTQSLKEELSATKQSLKEEITETKNSLKQEISASGKKVMGDIGNFMEDTLLPLIDEKADKADIERIERKLDRILDTNIDHERRIKNIESIPVIAHEIKHRKSR